LKKIALVSNTGWSLYNFRKNLMTALLAEGYEVIALSPADEYTARLHVRHIPVDISRKGTNPLGELSLMAELEKIYREENIDGVLHFTTKPNIWGTWAAARVSRRRKRPVFVVNNIAGLGIGFAKKGPVRWILENLYRFSQRNAGRIFFQNPDDFEMFQSARLVPGERIALLPGSGVDLKAFPFIPLTEKGDGEVSFVMSARLLKEKGVVEYVLAAERVKKLYPHITFRLLGKPDPGNRTSVSEAELEEWVNAGIIEWIPWSDDVARVLSASDCIVLPSYYREGTPRSLLEGMALGRPLITADSPGCRETVIPGRNGYMVEPRSVESLEMALLEYIRVPFHVKESLSRESRKIAEERFDEKIVINRYINIIDTLSGEVL